MNQNKLNIFILKLFTFSLLIFALFPKSSYSGQKILYVAAASNLTYVMPKMVKAFEEKEGDIKVRLSLASTGSLFMQIINGAPYDIFLAADEKRPSLLFEQSLTEGEPFIYGSGRLVLWSSLKSDLSGGIKILTSSQYKRIALANPKHAPYGEAAKKILIKEGLWKRLKSKLIFGENISQTAQFVQSGSAQIGFIAESMLRNKAIKKGSHLFISEEKDNEILQRGVILKGKEKNREKARAFRDFLLSSKGKEIMSEFGYGVR